MLNRIILAVFMFLAVSHGVSAETIAGAGSSAAFPVYGNWAQLYARDGGIRVSYEAVGSSAGVKKIIARETDFGASDVVPKVEELAKGNLVVIPTVITGAVPIYNLPKIRSGQIVLSGEVLAGIFLGEITRWDAKEIRDLNPNVGLPAMPILPVVRSDGSGTTYNFADYLAKVSPAWRSRLGVATSLKWPQHFAAEKGSQGVVDKVAATPGTIGYVDYNYVVDFHLSHAQMRNAEGTIVAPNPESFAAALKVGSWQKRGDFNDTLTNQAGKQSWPITMGTFVLLPRVADNPEKAAQVIRFFTWAFMRGDELANRLHFVRLPDGVQGKAFRALTEVVDREGRPIAYRSLNLQSGPDGRPRG